jgi:hypothetical protein
VRLKIKNKGRSTAHGVSVCTTSVTFTEWGGGSHTYNEDVLDLTLANGRDSPFMLATHAHRYVDLAIIEGGKNQLLIDISSKVIPPPDLKTEFLGLDK